MSKWNLTARTEATWRERIGAWRSSGQTMKEFAHGRGFAPATLRYWSSRLGKGKPPAFLRVVPRVEVSPGAQELTIEIASARVRVTRGFDAALLAEVVRALGTVPR